MYCRQWVKRTQQSCWCQALHPGIWCNTIVVPRLTCETCREPKGWTPREASSTLRDTSSAYSKHPQPDRRAAPSRSSSKRYSGEHALQQSSDPASLASGRTAVLAGRPAACHTAFRRCCRASLALPCWASSCALGACARAETNCQEAASAGHVTGADEVACGPWKAATGALWAFRGRCAPPGMTHCGTGCRGLCLPGGIPGAQPNAAQPEGVPERGVQPRQLLEDVSSLPGRHR